jgi:hypothetical protein
VLELLGGTKPCTLFNLKKQKLLQDVTTAKLELGAAEGELEQLLTELQVRQRAEKTAVTKVLEDALARTRAARKALASLEEDVVKDDD